MADTLYFSASGQMDMAYVAEKLGVSANLYDMKAALNCEAGAGPPVTFPDDFYGQAYMSISPPPLISVGYNFSSVNITLFCGRSWFFTENVSWITRDQSSGTGCTVVGIDIFTNTSAQSRTATLTLSSGGDSVTTTVKQNGAPTYSIQLGWAGTGQEACDEHDVNDVVTRYLSQFRVFSDADELYSNSSGTFAPSGWYSDGYNYRFWNGSSFTSTGTCSSGGGPGGTP